VKKTNPKLQKLIQTLNDGEFHDGTTLGDLLAITRAAVWKMINKLLDYDVPVESVKGKGYRLATPIILLDEKAIKKGLHNKQISVTIFESIASTHLYCRQGEKDNKINIALAEAQTAAIGRFARPWIAPFAKNIYFSMRYPFNKDVSELAGLSLLIGLSLQQTLQNELGIKSLKLKWPNDILHEGKKLAGVLMDVDAEANGRCHVIISFGLNVNFIKNQQAKIAQPWTSLQKITKVTYDRNKLLYKIINDLEKNITCFNEKGLTPFLETWEKNDYLQHKAITLKNFDKTIKGVVLGINKYGHLVLQQKNGVILECSSGDTTLLKGN
jgi:BirA family biotin operon repressor/biotin-[acetyl-CoA-carboxylase] ligase